MRKIILTIFCLLSVLVLKGQELANDANTSLLLHFNGNTTGASGENPTTQSNINYSSGIFNQAIEYGANTSLSYSAAGNIAAATGTLEAWVKPNWNGGDNSDHTLLSWGTWGGLLMMKDGGNYMKIIVNRYGGSGVNPEISVGQNVSGWLAGEWHHLAFTWSATEVKFYVDGGLIGQGTPGFTLPVISLSNFNIGTDNGNNPWNGTIEELRISNTVRSDTEIAQSYQNGIQPTAIIFKENNISLYPTWRYKPDMCTTLDGANVAAAPSIFTWTSANPNIAYANAAGDVFAVTPGTTVLTANIAGISANLNVTVETPVIAPQHPAMDYELTHPADCAKELMRVLIINYLPTNDGVHLDLNETGAIPGPNPMPLSSIDNTVTTNNIQLKYMLEERTKFRGYKDPGAAPYLGYQVVDYINVYEPIPRYERIIHSDGTPRYFIDYWQINERFNAQYLIDSLDVDEIWLWAYHTDVANGVAGWESNMSSPTTTDISNSNRDNNDLQVYSKTYMVYWFNYGRTPNLHNQGHQLEAIFGHIDNNMFWNNFVGVQNGNPPIGRCGDTHHPPNTTVDYDYLNTTLVASDIEDWIPTGGSTQLVNVNTWGNLSYDWPYNNVPPGEPEVNYYIYWMQNMPGYGNTIPYNSDYMSNWWQFVADWDAHAGDGLFQNNPVPLSNKVVGPCDLCDFQLFVSPMAFDGLYRANFSIESDATVNPNDNVSFRARDYIKLDAGFKVDMDTDFEAIIEGCAVRKEE